jgi:signal transduction histidine kinase
MAAREATRLVVVDADGVGRYPHAGSSGATVSLRAGDDANPATVRRGAGLGNTAVDVDEDSVARYPQQAEAAVYFCVLAALQKIQKYAQAGHAVVRLFEHNSALTFDVIDDGKAFDPASAKRGTGLTNMADRIDTPGGNLEVSSTPGRGTPVAGRIPVCVALAVATS